MSKAMKGLQDFANEHEMIFLKRSTIGFGRPCAGFLKAHRFIAYNPVSDTDMHPCLECDPNLEPPPTIKDAYHKDDYFAVLVNGGGTRFEEGSHNDISDSQWDEVYRQLLLWVDHYKEHGEVEIIEYDTGADPGATMTKRYGTAAYAIVFKKEAEAA